MGDCWFLSALAVVAQRRDLIAQLLQCAANSQGCYEVRLFLDGNWTATLLDDQLPCTEQQRRPDGSGLAYSRAQWQQLWVPLIEKAYAKAHGSYRAISGGEIHEALLDLTGCPCLAIDFDRRDFDPEVAPAAHPRPPRNEVTCRAVLKGGGWRGRGGLGPKSLCTKNGLTRFSRL